MKKKIVAKKKVRTIEIVDASSVVDQPGITTPPVQSHVRYALGCCYRLLREMGHNADVTRAMLVCLSAGFDAALLDDAEKTFRDSFGGGK